jgi:RNA polymerase sigma-70 factor (ECF subfamily)
MFGFGSSQSILPLVDAHYAALYRFAFRLCGCKETAADLTQDTFCQAQRKIDQLRDPGRAKSWLYAILRNAYLLRLRSSRTEKTVPLDDVGDIADPNVLELPDVDGPQLQQALDALPEAYRTPLILFYFEDFSYREIADHLDIALGTVMSRLARAKAFLKVRLSGGKASHLEEARRES